MGKSTCLCSSLTTRQKHNNANDANLTTAYERQRLCIGSGARIFHQKQNGSSNECHFRSQPAASNSPLKLAQ